MRNPKFDAYTDMAISRLLETAEKAVVSARERLQERELERDELREEHLQRGDY